MKAWIVYCGDEWCALMHANTAGKAKVLVMNEYSNENEFIEFTARRFKAMDDKAFTHQACKDAGFEYLDDWDGGVLDPEDFHNDCRCEICKGGEHDKVQAKSTT